MKFYAIGYERINGVLKFYAYTCKFFSERRQVDEDFYFELKKVFTLTHKNNKEISGMYFTPEL